MKREAERYQQLLTLPPVLNLQLMRFIYDPQTFTKLKVKDCFTVPNVINLSRLAQEAGSSIGEGAEESTEQYTYELKAVVYHRGYAAHAGHYVCDVWDERTQLWWRLDDHNAQQITSETATVLMDEEDSDNQPGKSKSKSKGRAKGKSNVKSRAAKRAKTEANSSGSSPASDSPSNVTDLTGSDDGSTASAPLSRRKVGRKRTQTSKSKQETAVQEAVDLTDVPAADRFTEEWWKRHRPHPQLGSSADSRTAYVLVYTRVSASQAQRYNEMLRAETTSAASSEEAINVDERQKLDVVVPPSDVSPVTHTWSFVHALAATDGTAAESSRCGEQTADLDTPQVIAHISAANESTAEAVEDSSEYLNALRAFGQTALRMNNEEAQVLPLPQTLQTQVQTENEVFLRGIAKYEEHYKAAK